ncbi:hypothetical protein [Mucilaginibacter flavus]|uniref:hypothetical protein n=1 Tax=Mucilaginibacter flavus TaxID=931504 RepID=UPI0025B5D610|nr:hypothetical protein [Mucilaginibacter flavus]MDN3582109.1 hypothetical protein [Mucilaginibacter flavus]
MTTQTERQYSITEVLVKTTYQISVHKEPSFDRMPIGFGAGFFLNYKKHLFFITADHNIHFDDHALNERTGVDNHVGILNNVSDKANFSTVMSPVGGFYFMESFDISKEDLDFQLFDVAISLVDRTKFEAPFLTDEEFLDADGVQLVAAKAHKFELSEEHIAQPSTEDCYFIYGKIKPQLKGLILHRENTFKENISYVASAGSYLLLNTAEEITDSKDWEGLSGSPVLNQNGQCIGVLCSVNEGSKAVFVKPFSKIMPLLDLIIVQEQLERDKKL